MKKRGKSSQKKSIILLSLISLLLIFALVFTFLPFSYGEDGVKEYKSVVGIIKKGIDISGGVYVVMEPIAPTTEPALTEYNKNFDANLEGTIKILEKRLAAKGYTEATVVRQSLSGGGTSIRIEIPNVDNATDAFNIIGKAAVLEFRDESGKVLLEGSYINNAFVSTDSNGQYCVGLTLSDEGNKIFAKATGDNIGKKINIYIDDELISSPSVESAIPKNPIITGNYTYESASDFAMQLNSGALSLKFETLEPRVMSATLGQDALQTGLLAGIIGISLIIVFMLFIYRGFGIASGISLLIYMVILLFLMSQLPWVQLTLPGIAGIILGIGMAVDANIIIFERIKDEYSAGKSLMTSVNAGFKNATSSIVDSNITTIIAAIVLWILGTGPIQGFAITLFLGIIVSMFCSLVITRFLLKLLLPLNNKEKFYALKRGVMENE